MPVNLFNNPLMDSLFERVKDFVGLFDTGLGWFTRVNPAGYLLPGYCTTTRCGRCSPKSCAAPTGKQEAVWEVEHPKQLLHLNSLVSICQYSNHLTDLIVHN